MLLRDNLELLAQHCAASLSERFAYPLPMSHGSKSATKTISQLPVLVSLVGGVWLFLLGKYRDELSDVPFYFQLLATVGMVTLVRLAVKFICAAKAPSGAKKTSKSAAF